MRGKVAGLRGRTMTSALTRLLTLLAFVLMPFGMTGAPAYAQPVADSHSAMTMGARHCDEHPVKDKAPSSKMDCTATCTATRPPWE